MSGFICTLKTKLVFYVRSDPVAAARFWVYFEVSIIG